VDGTAAVRVRFEIAGAESKRNGVRCENERDVNGAPLVLTKNQSVNDNSKSERREQRPIVKQNRTSGANAEKKQENSLRTDDGVKDVGKDEKDANDERDYSQIIDPVLGGVQVIM